MTQQITLSEWLDYNMMDIEGYHNNPPSFSDLALDEFLSSLSSSESYSPPQTETSEHNSSSHSPRSSSNEHADALAQHVCTNSHCGCGKSFRRRSDLKKHLEQRTKPYSCTHRNCPRQRFSTKHDRDRHEREVHGPSDILCPVAGCKRHIKGFARRDNLTAHMRNMHPSAELRNNAEPPAQSQQQQHASMTSHQPILATTTLAVSPSLISHTTTSPSSQGSNIDNDMLLAGLQERLVREQMRREILAQQLLEVDGTIFYLEGAVERLGQSQWN